MWFLDIDRGSMGKTNMDDAGAAVNLLKNKDKLSINSAVKTDLITRTSSVTSVLLFSTSIMLDEFNLDIAPHVRAYF